MFVSILIQTLTESYKQLNEKLSKVSLIGNPTSKSVAFKALNDLQVKHYELCALATDANKIFSFPILLGISNDLQTITGCLYVVWIRAKGQDTEVPSGVAIGWCLVLFLRTWCLVKGWVDLAKQVRFF